MPTPLDIPAGSRFPDCPRALWRIDRARSPVPGTPPARGPRLANRPCSSSPSTSSSRPPAAPVGEALAQYQLVNLESIHPAVGGHRGAGLRVPRLLVAPRHARHELAVARLPPDAPSAERVDSFGAFYFSPLDVVGWTVLASLTLTVAWA